MAQTKKKTIKTTPKKAVPKKAVKNAKNPKVLDETEEGEPMTFHDNPRKNIVWYTVSAALVSVVVLANIIPSDMLIGKGEPLEPTSVVSRTNIGIPTKVDIIGGSENIKVNKSELAKDINSIDDLEGLLKENVRSVEGALNAISKREVRTVQQLDAIAKTALGLDVRLAQLQEEITSLKIKKEEEAKIQDPSRIFLGQMIIFLTDAYHRGSVTHKQLNNLKEFSLKISENEGMAEAVDALIKVTPDEGPVTLTELSLLAGHLMTAGTPEVEDLLKTSTEEGFVGEAKRYLSDWVELKKISVDENTNPWVQTLSQIQIALSRGNVEKVQSLIESEKAFERDLRIAPLQTKIKTYIEQQKALNATVTAYSENYVMSAQ
tara:strand:+ start:118479 stop:119606 length:1128 start_codon:yes stop_codon:yes gene_type:complete